MSGTFYAWGDTSDTSDIAYNSAPFYNRDGVLMGVHNKNELYGAHAWTLSLPTRQALGRVT